jgi:hypothetical protein
MKATAGCLPLCAGISIIAVAAPSDEPQTAVVPGSTHQRVSSHPQRSTRRDHRDDDRPKRAQLAGFLQILSKGYFVRSCNR